MLKLLFGKASRLALALLAFISLPGLAFTETSTATNQKSAGKSVNDQEFHRLTKSTLEKLSPASQGSNSLSRPNIVFILADDLGYGDLGCYGQKQIKTPNIDKLAADGIRFTDFYAGATVCAPSRCSLMTGLHGGHALIRGNATLALRPQDKTVAEVLKAAGYHTAIFGKWGLGNEGSTGVPQKKGFEEFLGYLDQVHAHNYYPDFLWRYDPPTGFDGKMSFPENADGQTGVYSPDLFTKAAVEYLKGYSQDSKKRSHPFFLYLPYILPHANNEEGARTGNGMQVPSDSPYSLEKWPQVEKNKAAMITRLDAYVGKILQTLDNTHLTDNTIVFFTSDNGPHSEGGSKAGFFHSSGPSRGIKRDLFEGGIRVPLIARWTGRIKPGEQSALPSAFWDFLPTAAGLAGVSPPPSDGISLLPTLLGREQTAKHDFLYWEFHERGFQQAARMENWKALRPQLNQALELYDLSNDLGEKTNVAALHPKVIEKFESFFKVARTDSSQWPLEKKTAGKKSRKKQKQ